MTAENAHPSSTWMQRIDAPGRLLAFGIHIAASIAVVGSIGGLMLWLWFPQPWSDRGGEYLFWDPRLDPLHPHQPKD